MSYVLSYIFLATSALSIFFIARLIQTKKALERELLLLKENIPKDEEIKALKDAAILEIEKSKLLEKEKLEQELAEKRRQNDEEISKKQEVINRILEDYKKSQKETIENYLKTEMNLAMTEITLKKTELNDELSGLQEQVESEKAKIEQLRRNQQSVTEAIMRNALENEQYSLSIDDVSKAEIKELYSVAYKYSRIRPIILKAVYDIYYAPEVKKLVSRIIGPNKITGIYKITSKVDGRVYVGKSVDISERWVTHFKRAAGVETETTNLLYPAMRSAGLENFTFEVLEEVKDSSILGQREKYWQEFYDAKTHGLSVR